jgi:putative ABC transport system permease protein
MDEFYISLTPDANTTLVVDALDQKCRLYGYNPWIGTTADTVQKVQNGYNQAEVLALSITTFSIVVSALGIVAAMAYTTLERRREIGLLMTLGLDRRQNTTVIVGETVLLCLLGITVGASTGIGLSYFVVQSISWWSSIPQPALALSPYTLPVAAATIILAALTTSVYLANRMSKLNLVDALRR